jgi:sodium transport system permease protein
MSSNITLTVFLKEMTDILRDRRSLFSMIVLPVVIFPLIFFALNYFLGEAEKRAETEATSIAVLRSGVPKDFVAVIALSGLKTIEVDDVEAAVKSNGASTGVRFSPDSQLITVFAEGTRPSSQVATERLRAALNDYRERLVLAKLKSANLDASALKPFTVKRENVASARKMGGFALGSMIGYIVILLMYTGGMSPAIDLAAGEKERKTLEALIASPASRREIVFGKILACVSAAYASALLTTASLFLSLRGGGMATQGMDKLLGNISIDALTIGLVLFTLVPVAVMAGSLMLAISLFSRSTKEAHSYLAPLIMLVVFPSILGGVPGMELTPLLSLIPIYNSSQLLKAILQGEVQMASFVISNLANFAYSWICFYFAVRFFNDEKVLFRT